MESHLISLHHDQLGLLAPPVPPQLVDSRVSLVSSPNLEDALATADRPSFGCDEVVGMLTFDHFRLLGQAEERSSDVLELLLEPDDMGSLFCWETTEEVPFRVIELRNGSADLSLLDSFGREELWLMSLDLFPNSFIPISFFSSLQNLALDNLLLTQP